MGDSDVTSENFWDKYFEYQVAARKEALSEVGKGRVLLSLISYVVTRAVLAFCLGPGAISGLIFLVEAASSGTQAAMKALSELMVMISINEFWGIWGAMAIVYFVGMIVSNTWNSPVNHLAERKVTAWWNVYKDLMPRVAKASSEAV